MAASPIVFALANPIPEIMPEEAAARAWIVATGRSDYPNQINNVLAFPGIFRGALDVRVRRINEPMKLAAAQAISLPLHRIDLRRDDGKRRDNPIGGFLAQIIGKEIICSGRIPFLPD